MQPSSSEDSSDEGNAPKNVELPVKKTNKPVAPTKPASSDSDSSDDSDAAQKLPQSTPITKPQKKQDVKAAPVSKQLPTKKQPDAKLENKKVFFIDLVIF